MKPFLIHQLERYAERLTELDFLLSREDIMADMAQFMKLSREHADVAAVAQRYARYKQRLSDLQAARQMQAELPPADEMHALAKEEIAEAETDITTLEAELQRMLLQGPAGRSQRLSGNPRGHRRRRIGPVRGRPSAHVHTLCPEPGLEG